MYVVLTGLPAIAMSFICFISTLLLSKMFLEGWIRLGPFRSCNANDRNLCYELHVVRIHFSLVGSLLLFQNVNVHVKVQQHGK